MWSTLGKIAIGSGGGDWVRAYPVLRYSEPSLIRIWADSGDLALKCPNFRPLHAAMHHENRVYAIFDLTGGNGGFERRYRSCQVAPILVQHGSLLRVQICEAADDFFARLPGWYLFVDLVR